MRNVKLRKLILCLLQKFCNNKSETEGLAPKTIVNLNLFLHKALLFAVEDPGV